MSEDKSSYLVPGSIIIAGALIAGALYMGGGVTVSPQNNKGNTGAAGNIIARAVTVEDHLLGDPNAPVKIVEFSDLDCPFCKEFHATMKTIMDEYGKDGRVAWVYRNLPLDSLHPNARKKAVSAECVAKIGGNTAYWNYIDKIIASGGNPDLTLLPKFAGEVGVNVAAFNTCLNSGEMDKRVEADEKDAISAGARGTPYSVIMTKDKSAPVSGAIPLPQMKQLLDQALADS